MGLRQRFLDLLSSGTPPERDPRSPVEVAEVRLADGPMLVSALQAEGIEAYGIESAMVGHSMAAAWNKMRIMVRREDAEAALALIDEMR